MSGLTKTLIKLISAVLAVYLVVAAIPAVKQYMQSEHALINASTTPATATLLSVTLQPASGTLQAVQSSPTPTSNNKTSSNSTSSPASATTLTQTATPGATSTLVIAKASQTPSNLVSSNATQNPTYVVNIPVVSSANYPYEEQSGVPVFTQNFSHAEYGCSWMSVAGQVFDATGSPVTNLVIDVQGTLNGSSVDLVGMTGLAKDFGPGGYEIQLANVPVATSASLTIQVFDLSGNPLSAKIPFNTSADCTQNVIIINFTA